MEKGGDDMSTIAQLGWYHERRHMGLSLIELMIVVAIIGIIGAIATLVYESYTESAKVKKAVSEIAAMQVKIKIYEVQSGGLPDSLTDVGDFTDPWGNPYQFTNFSTVPRGKWRKDRNLVPINTDYDLFSMGPDGKSMPPLTAKQSRDDIIRANDGAYIGKAGEY